MKMAEKLSKREENTVGKGEIAHYEQFLLFPSVFSKDLHCRHKNKGLFGGRVNKEFVTSVPIFYR